MALDWYDHELHRGIATYAREHLWMLNTQMSRLRDFPKGWIGDGAIGLFDRSSALTRHIIDNGIPAVDIGSRINGHFFRIKTDNFKVGAMAAQHLLDRGYKRCIFAYLQNSTLEAERCEGYRHTLLEAGAQCIEWHLRKGKEYHDLPYTTILKWFSKKLKTMKPPLAVFAQNDDAASILLSAAIESGFRVPEQVAVLGADNTELICDFAAVPMSSVDCNLFELGYNSARILDRMMQGQSVDKESSLVPPTKVALRQSTHFLAVSDPHVLTVLEYMRKHFNRKLSVTELAAQVPLSRTALYRLFVDEIGHSMMEELVRLRINEAKKLLRETRMKIGEITTHCGFSTIINFSRAFQNSCGMSPSEYRAKHQSAA